jgi:hypothetical protein
MIIYSIYSHLRALTDIKSKWYCHLRTYPPLIGVSGKWNTGVGEVIDLDRAAQE